MDWTTEVNHDYFLTKQKLDFEAAEIKAITLRDEMKKFPHSLSPFCQFFIGAIPAVTLDLLTSIPIPDNYSYESILRELAPHYQKIQSVVNSKGVIRYLNFQNVKPESAQLLYSIYQHNKLEPLVESLYFKTKAFPAPPHNGAKIYKVKPSSITPIDLPSFESAWELIKKCYAKENMLSITPYGWMYFDQLAESTAIRYFINRCQEILLFVNNDNHQITGISLIL